MARKSGIAAFDAAPRSLSKKQKKRHVKRLEVKLAKVDPRREKIKENNMKKQMSSPEMKAFIEKTESKLVNFRTRITY
jgi:pyruvate/2-oxoglutarate dehydrogenase complex dihydrolipoamide acyltransferase (E2) component